VCIEESEKKEAKEHHFMEVEIMQKDTREENVVAKEEQLSIKVELKVQQAT
jgi:hypothetical protein